MEASGPGAHANPSGKAGGHGGFGFFNTCNTTPLFPYAVGAGGTAGGMLQVMETPGGAGTASSFNTNLVANGGNGGGIDNSGETLETGTLNNETYAYIDGNNFAEINVWTLFLLKENFLPVSTFASLPILALLRRSLCFEMI